MEKVVITSHQSSLKLLLIILHSVLGLLVQRVIGTLMKKCNTLLRYLYFRQFTICPVCPLLISHKSMLEIVSIQQLSIRHTSQSLLFIFLILMTKLSNLVHNTNFQVPKVNLHVVLVLVVHCLIESYQIVMKYGSF